MRRMYVIAIVAIILAVAAAAVLVPMLEKGIASQSQTDSTDEMEPGMYVKATSIDGSMVSVPSVTYTLSENKEYYELADLIRSSSGSLRVKTPNDGNMGLRVVIDFQESGSWMFIDTIDLSLSRQTGFIVLVENGVTLTGTTVIWLNGNSVSYQTGLFNEAGKNVANKPSDWSSSDKYKPWAYGTTEMTGDYTLSTSDVYNGFVVLVKDGGNISGYDVIKINNSVTPNATVNIGRPVGYVIPDMDGDFYKKWRVWYSNNVVTGYTIDKADALDKSDAISTFNIYNSVGEIGVAGNPSENITVKTGYYDYSLDVKYKSKIRVDPTAYHGKNMVSNVVFLLGNKDPIKDPLDGVTVKFHFNDGTQSYEDRVVYYESKIDVRQLANEGSLGLTTPSDWKYWDGTAVSTNTFDASHANSKRFAGVVNNDYHTSGNTLVKINEDGSGTVETGLADDHVVNLNGNWYLWGDKSHDPVGVHYSLKSTDAIDGLIVLVNEHYDMSKINGTYGKYVVIKMEANGKFSSSIPELTRTGYHLKGWYSDPSQEIGLITADSLVPDNVSEMEYYAHWVLNSTEVTLDSGTPVTSTVTWTYNDSVDGYDLSKPDKTGYTFGGYFTFPAGKGTKIYDEDGEMCVTNSGFVSGGKMVYNADGFHGTITLYALWTETISLNANGGSGGDDSLTVTYNSRIFTPITAPNKEGYTFAGYATAASDGTILINADSLEAFVNGNVEGYLADGKWIKNEAGGNTTVLYAQWTISQYTVTLDLESGILANVPDGWAYSSGIYSKDFNYNTPYTEIIASIVYEAEQINPTKPGHSFSGWSPNEGNLGAADATLTATWNINHYKVTLDLDGGTLANTPTDWTETAGVYSKVFNYNTSYSDIIASIVYDSSQITPTKTGYTFAAWSPNTGNLGAEDATLTATWNINHYKVTLDLDGGTLANTPTDWTETAGVYSKVFNYNTSYSDIIASIVYEAEQINPTKTGYTFAAWSPNTGNLGAEDATLTATWTENQVTIIFNANGGTGQMSNQVIHYSDVSKALSSNGFTKPSSSSGFGVWCTQTNGEGTILVPGQDMSDYIVGVNSQITLYALWKYSISIVGEDQMSHITSSLAEAYYGQTVRLTHTGNYHSAPQIDIVALGISGESFIDDGDGGYYEFTMTDCNVTVKKHNGN